MESIKLPLRFNIIKKYRSVSYVFIANIISLGVGAVLSFLIPYILDIDNYGYYKQFTLYLSYIGLMHFGFNDGIYLEYGGYDYENLDKLKFRMYFRYLFYQQILVFLIFMVFILMFSRDINSIFIYLFVCLNMVLLNFVKFFSFICQITRDYLFYSIEVVIEKTGLIIPIVLMFLFSIKVFQYVVISQTLVNLLVCVICFLKYKELIYGNKERIGLSEIKKILTLGFSLMLGNFIIILIFNIDRFMIDMLLPIKDFSIYSLAVQLLSVILVFSTSISMLVYPYLKRRNIGTYKEQYDKLTEIFLVLTVIALGLFFPIKYLIALWLPHYHDSIKIFMVLLPSVILRGEIDVVFNNLFKSLKKQQVYLIISLIILLLSIFLNILFYRIKPSVLSFSYATTIAVICWYILSDVYLMRYFKTYHLKKYIIIIIFLNIYIFTTNYSNLLIGFVIYFILSIIYVINSIFKYKFTFLG